jgi:hypothetical protein
MGALSKFIFGGDRYYSGGKWVIPEPATLELGMAEADLSNKNLGAGGAIIVSAWITHKDNGAMTSLNLASNNIGNEGAKAVANAIKVSTWILLLWFAWHRLTTIIICWRLFWIANIHRTREEPTNC